VACHKPSPATTTVRAAISYQVSTTCTSCHNDIHRGALGSRCESCHRP
jgi:predicted CXXCH cytochrome family protein